jgi:hypothetical protein
MSTTPSPIEQTESTEPTEPAEPTPTTDRTEPQAASDERQARERRFEAGAPRQFAASNHAPLPPALGDERWATGEP